MGAHCTNYIRQTFYNNIPKDDYIVDHQQPIVDKTESDIVSQTQYHYLVFSGGGIKGVSYCGVVAVLEKYKILNGIQGYAGTSAGAIIASLLAVGYDATDLKKIMFDLDTRNLVDDKFGVIRDGINFVEKYGAAPGNFFYDFMGKLIKAKTGNADFSINDLYRDFGIKLVIVGTDLNNCMTRYFYPLSKCPLDGDIPIRLAVRISMGVPFLFEPILYKNNYHVDGGVLDNYPLHVFDGEYPGDPAARLGLCKPNDAVLGINIISDNRIIDYKLVHREEINSLLQYGTSFIKTFMIENDRRMMSPANQLRTISVITPNYPISEIEISNENKQELYNMGYDCTTNFLTKK